MRNTQLGDAPAEELVADYIEIGILQHDPLEYHDTDEFNELFDERHAIEQELKSRPGDQRSLLLPLLTHEDVQVRLNAVRDTLAVNSVAARQALEDIANSHEIPQNFHARMTIGNLGSGRWVLD